MLDHHVVSSVPTHYIGPHLQFETTRSPLGELLYRLKYRGGHTGVADIADTVADFVSERWGLIFDCIVPAPPSVHRARQPVVQIAD